MDDYRKRYIQEHREKLNENSRRWFKTAKGRAASKRARDKVMSDPERHKRKVENQRRYNREHSLIVNGKHRRVNKRPRPDNNCEVCDKIVMRLHYHHWNDNRPELGVWVCGRCHLIIEEYEKGLITVYLILKARVCRD